MATKTFQCSVITPSAMAYEGQVDEVVVPAHDGEIGVLVNRSPLLCKLGAGRLRVRQGDQETSWFVEGGFAQVLDNEVTVLTQQATPVGELDADEARQMLTDALQMKATDEVDVRTKAKLEETARAMLRIARK